MRLKEKPAQYTEVPASDPDELPPPVTPEELTAQERDEQERRRLEKQAALKATVEINLKLGIVPSEEILNRYGRKNYRRVEAVLKQASLFDET